MNGLGETNSQLRLRGASKRTPCYQKKGRRNTISHSCKSEKHTTTKGRGSQESDREVGRINLEETKGDIRPQILE